MPEHIATLIVILTIATAIFVLAKKQIESIVQPQEFILWRNAWFIITLIAFLASNFWVYILATGLYVNYVIKKVENRIAFFMQFCLLSLSFPSGWALSFILIM